MRAFFLGCVCWGRRQRRERREGEGRDDDDNGVDDDHDRESTFGECHPHDVIQVLSQDHFQVLSLFQLGHQE